HAQSDPVMPEQLDQIAATPAKCIQRAVVRVLCQPFLYEHGKTYHSLTHISRTTGQVNPQADRRRDHRIDSAASTRHSAPWSTAAPTRTTTPLANTISIRPSDWASTAKRIPPSGGSIPPSGSRGAADITVPAGVGTISTRAKPGVGCGTTAPSSPRTIC